MESPEELLVREIMLQVNEGLYIKGVISRELYEHTKVKVVNAKAPL